MWLVLREDCDRNMTDSSADKVYRIVKRSLFLYGLKLWVMKKTTVFHADSHGGEDGEVYLWSQQGKDYVKK